MSFYLFFLLLNIQFQRNNYIHLNMEDITDSDYAHLKRAFQDFETKKLEKYHNLYFKAIYYC